PATPRISPIKPTNMRSRARRREPGRNDDRPVTVSGRPSLARAARRRRLATMAIAPSTGTKISRYRNDGRANGRENGNMRWPRADQECPHLDQGDPTRDNSGSIACVVPLGLPAGGPNGRLGPSLYQCPEDSDSL